MTDGQVQKDKDKDTTRHFILQMAKCTFHKYGPTGTIQRHDGLCILPVCHFIFCSFILVRLVQNNFKLVLLRLAW